MGVLGLKFQNDEVPAHGGQSMELLGLAIVLVEKFDFFFKMMKYLPMGGKRNYLV